MTAMIMGQLRFVLMSACTGMALMACYDLLRFLRWLIPRGTALVAVEDILFWCSMALPVYLVFYRYNDGAVRWYGIAAVLFGSALYEWGISRGLRAFGRRVFDGPRRRLHIWLKKQWRRGKDWRKKRRAAAQEQRMARREERRKKAERQRREEERREKAERQRREEEERRRKTERQRREEKRREEEESRKKVKGQRREEEERRRKTEGQRIKQRRKKTHKIHK